jgi:hypothetical protein
MIKNTIMEDKYFNYLRDDLKYLGFGDNTLLHQQLEDQILKDVEGFELYTDAYFDEHTRLEAKMYFRRSGSKDRYFFNKYDALLIYSEEPIRNRAQTFYVYLGKGITFKESFNLLQGRSVYKNMINLEGEKYKAWLKLDFGEKDLHGNYKIKQYGLRYGYELEKVLERYPIKELQEEKTRAELHRSLQRGNLQPVTFAKSTKSEKMYIEANPVFKTINIYPSPPVKTTKKTADQPPLPPADDPGEHLADPFLQEVEEEETDPAEEVTTAEEITTMEEAAVYSGKEQVPVPEYTMVKRVTARKRIRK